MSRAKRTKQSALSKWIGVSKLNFLKTLSDVEIRCREVSAPRGDRPENFPLFNLGVNH